MALTEEWIGQGVFVNEPVWEPLFWLVVYGTPAAGGSKRVVPVGKKGERRFVVTDASKNAAPWKMLIRQHAGGEMQGKELLTGPLEVAFTFYAKRPQSHFGTGKNANKLKQSASKFPVGKPDCLKLARLVEDSLTGIVYRDDAQIVTERLAKRYGVPERVEVEIRRATEW